MFFTPPNSLVGHNQPILRPPKVSEQLDYEGEIALVIGTTGRHIPPERALEYVAGITLCNEGTIRDWIRHGRFNVTQGKNLDATGSIGPWMTTGVDLTQPLHITVKINGEVTQDDTTASMIFCFAESDRLCHDLHDAQAGRHHRHRHADEKGAAQRSAALAMPATCSR